MEGQKFMLSEGCDELAKCKNLTDLNVRHCFLKSEDLQHLAELPLKILNLKLNKALTDDGIVHIAADTLEYLDVQGKDREPQQIILVF